MQVFNPTWVQPTAATGNRSGLLVRSQNCTPPNTASGCGPTCSGNGDHASWLTWAELADDGGAAAAPKVVNHVTAGDAVWGPFDCTGNWMPHGGFDSSASGSGCVDERGTEDPRLTFDAETGLYTLIYNAWGSKGAFVAAATTKDPTTGPAGWTRHGPIFPIDDRFDGWPGKSGSIVLMPAPGPHFLIWSCASALRITPSIGRSTVQWAANQTKILFTVRKHPFWDTGFVESAMPPLKLSDGNLLFFYDSVGPWNGTSGFQPGWAVLSGQDPSVVLARASVPPLPYTLPWEKGLRPTWPCNTKHVSNLGGGHAVEGPNPLGGDDLFRVYFGGADAVIGSALISVTLAPVSGKFRCERQGDTGLSQCVPDASGGGVSGFAACHVSCAPAPPPPPRNSMVAGTLYKDTDISGDNQGSDAAVKSWQECEAACAKPANTTKGCVAFTFDNRTSCPEGACCWFKGPNLKPVASPGRLSMVLKK
jgi:predicted GH43/DUF377 family glycosyl hydrolase